ncbi:AmmeMemoRadiSam system protein A [Candidatus Acetothermia bacterium]|jgi:AmmeMemoRadiSam system protein A|nr:AmmeMemoRadiSam system protein A [Candidatus Acetothermia bacterium]MCI2427033.1 AmmeMemoRadiSam system protein A [Candidatus Acetothermia bacterium]MCI2428140.1 AmmeMemoRadiSam system protein A [Candidatus Acetothermia bacterium]
MDDFVQLAKAAVETYICCGEVILPPAPLPMAMKERAGVFVSLKKEGRLRGCIGTFLPEKENIAEEIIANAIKAATLDNRFPPLKEMELATIDYTVDLLSPPEKCTEDDLDPKQFGLLIEAGGRRGLLLPDLPDIITVKEQLRIARMKAKIPVETTVKIYRFTVERHR